MKEIISVHCGGAGIRIGEAFWNQQCLEFGVDLKAGFNKDKLCQGNDGSEIGSYFNVNDGKYRPRTVFCDTSPNDIEAIKLLGMKDLFNPGAFLCGNEESGIWAKGHYTDGAEIIDSIVKLVTTEAEKCQSLSGIQFFGSIGGGTGGGLGTILTQKVQEFISDKFLMGVNVFPSAGINNHTCETYNALLSIGKLNELDLSMTFDNNSIYNQCIENGIKNPNYSDVNNYISKASNFHQYVGGEDKGLIDLDLLKSNLTNKLHKFVTTTQIFASNKKFENCSSNLLNLISDGIFYSSVNVNVGVLKYFHFTFRGPKSMNYFKIAESKYEDMKDKLNTDCMFSSHTCKWSGDGQDSITAVGNVGGISGIFRQIDESFTAMFRRKAFLHLYTGEGMDEMEFTEASSNLNDLISCYNQ